MSIDFHRLVRPIDINRLIFIDYYQLYRLISDDRLSSIGHAGKVWISQAEAVPFFARPKCSDYTGSDVVGGAENDCAMADKRAKRGGMNYCAAGGPNKVNCSSRTGTPGISVHFFPKNESLRQKWTRFVRTHRKDFEPKKSSCLCSAHFDDSCFERKPVFHGDGSGEAVEMRKLLIKGSVPSKNSVFSNTSPLTKRKRRRVSEVYVYKHSMLCHHVRV